MKKPTFDKQVDDIMENLQWEKIKQVMDHLEWRWGSCDGVPSIYAMMNCARDLLQEAWKLKDGSCASGGFYAQCRNGLLMLAFHIDRYEIEFQ